MSHFTHFFLSAEKGFCANIGKITHLRKEDGTPYVDAVLYLAVANQDTHTDNKPSSQIIHAYFSQMPFIGDDKYCVGDFVRVQFEHIQLSKGISQRTGNEVVSIRVKANTLQLIQRAHEKKTQLASNQ